MPPLPQGGPTPPPSRRGGGGGAGIPPISPPDSLPPIPDVAGPQGSLPSATGGQLFDATPAAGSQGSYKNQE